MLCKHAAEAGTLKPKPAHQDSTGAHKQSLRATLSGLRRSSALPGRAVVCGGYLEFVPVAARTGTDRHRDRSAAARSRAYDVEHRPAGRDARGPQRRGLGGVLGRRADTRQRRPRRESAVVGSCQRRAGRDAGGPERRYDLSGLLARRAPPGELLLASAAVDGAVRLWDIRKRASISQLGIGVALLALAWGPCGITVGTSAGGVVQLGVIER